MPKTSRAVPPAGGSPRSFSQARREATEGASGRSPAVARCLQQTESLFAENYELFSAPSTFSDILVSSASEAKTSPNQRGERLRDSAPGRRSA